MPATLPDVGAPDVLYIVDLSGYIFRSYHAITTPLTSPGGEPTSTTLGTVTMLQRLLAERRPALLAIAMDSSTPTFRREIDPNYKANRPPAPADLKAQVVRCREIVEAYRFPIIQRDGFEADDLIASAVRRAREHKLRVVICSADKDLMQLVGPDVVVYDTMRFKIYGPDEVKEKFGVGPAQLRDALALMGDTSDNVPGVPHVGPKKAAELLEAYGTIDGIYANVDKIKAKATRETVKNNEAQARLSQRLVTLRDDLDIGEVPAAFTSGAPDKEKLRTLFTELNFSRLLQSIDDGQGAGQGAGQAAARAQKPAAAPLPGKRDRRYHAITTLEQLDAFVEAASKAPQLAVDTETTGLDPRHDRLVGISLSIDPAEGYYLPLSHDWGLGALPQLSLADVKARLGPVLAADSPAKIGHNWKFDLVVLEKAGFTVGKIAFDSMLASYVLDPDQQHGLKEMAKRELGETMTTFEEVAPKVKGKQPSFATVALEPATAYAGADAAFTLDLAQRLAPTVESLGVDKLLSNVEIPLIRVLASLEDAGILVDTAKLREIGREVDAKLIDLEKRAKEAAGKDFNVNSPRQLETLLFDDLGLSVIKRTKTGRSTDAEVLEALTEQHPLPAIILEHRQLAKLKGTYIDALPQLIDRKDGRIHTSFNQTVAATGRLSSSDPNLQNIPVRTDVGRQIRSAFIAKPGHKIVSADYSQIELRLLAHLSKDPVLLDSFKRGEDVHTRTACEMLGKKREEVTSDDRRVAKTINFGVIYGMGDTALAKRLGIEKEKATAYIEAYFKRYAGVKAYQDKVLAEAKAAGSVTTMLGRRRFLPDLSSANRALRLAAERVATNTPIQGTAADVLKLAMVALKDPVTPGSRMLLTVHDELVFEVPDAEVEAAGQKAKAMMEGVVSLEVPLTVEVGHGATWADAHG